MTELKEHKVCGVCGEELPAMAAHVSYVQTHYDSHLDTLVCPICKLCAIVGIKNMEKARIGPCSKQSDKTEYRKLN